MSDERSLARPATAKEVAAELHELQRADADQARRKVLVDILAQAFGYASALRKDTERRAAAGWDRDAWIVPPVPPRIPEALRMSREVFGIERAVDQVEATWREIITRPTTTRPTSAFGTKLLDVWKADTTARARREADLANDAVAAAAAELLKDKCDERVRLKLADVKGAVKAGAAWAPTFTARGVRSPYVKDQARTGDNRE